MPGPPAAEGGGGGRTCGTCGSIKDSWQVRPGKGMCGGWGGWVPGIGGPPGGMWM